MKRLIFLFVFGIMSLVSFGQTKNGWHIYKSIDTYTQEINYECKYYKNSFPIATFFPNTQKICILSTYDGLKYFDNTWDALMYYNGNIQGFNTFVEERLIFNNDYKEYENYVSINCTSVDRAGETFLGGFIFDENVEELKKAKSVSYKYYDKIKNETVTINISLIGFTKCYNECIKYNTK